MSKDNNHNNNNTAPNNNNSPNNLTVRYKNPQNAPKPNQDGDEFILSCGARPFYKSPEHKEEYYGMLFDSIIKNNELNNQNQNNQTTHDHNSKDDDDIDR